VTVAACPGVIATVTRGWLGCGSCCRPGTRSWGPALADDKQAAVVTDHDSRVLARRRVSARAWELGGLLGWAVARAARRDLPR
jgi:hypothetical protein